MAADLLRSLRRDEEGDERLRSLKPDEWIQLTDQVEEALGLQLLARRLQRADVVPPAAICTRLRLHGMRVAARNLEGRVTLAEAIRITQRPALLLKGVDLAERVYGNLGQRAMGDVDFLVRVEDVPAYHDHLCASGLRATSIPHPELIAATWQHHTLYLAPEGQLTLPVELHWRLANGDNDAGIDLPALWERALPHTAFAPLARVMAPDDLFLYLCLHLKHHVFEVPLTSLWDLAELLTSSSMVLDWARIWERAEAWNLVRSVQVALYLVTHVLGVPTRHLSNWQPSQPLAAQLPNPLPLLGEFPEYSVSRLGTLLTGQATWRERSRAVVRGIAPSRVEVRSRYGVPGQGFWRDMASYLRRLRLIWRRKWRFAVAFRTNNGGTRQRIDRVTDLRTYLEGPDQAHDN